MLYGAYLILLFSDSLQIPFSPHVSHLGLRAVHTYLPCNISQWCAVGISSLGIYFTKCFSVANGVVHVWGTSPMR